MSKKVVSYSVRAGICATGLLALNFLACRNTIYFNPRLVVSPTPEVAPGKSVVIYVTGTSSEGITYKWSVDSGGGECNPQMSNEKQTTYTAPQGLIGDIPEAKEEVKIRVQYFHNNNLVGDDTIPITVKRLTPTALSPVASTSPQPVATASLPTAPSPSSSGEPEIEITRPGLYEEKGMRFVRDGVAGQVKGVNPADYRVILYTQTTEWFIQPYREGGGRFTTINSNRSFSNDVHTGVRYAALLVKKSYTNPPAATLSLPDIGGDVVAVSIVMGVKNDQ